MLMSSVEFHVVCMEVGLDLCCHVVIGVVLGVTTQTQYPWWSRCDWCRARFHHADATKYRVLCSWILLSNCAFVDRLYSVIVNSSVAKLLHTFLSRKRVIWGVVFTPPVGHSRQPSAVNDQSVWKQIELVSEFRRSLPNTESNGSHRSLNTLFISFLTLGKTRSPPWTLPIPPCRRWTSCLPLFVLVWVRRHMWFFSCFLLESLQDRLFEIRTMSQWHSIRTLLLWMRPPCPL